MLKISFQLNGRPVEVVVDEQETLLFTLRRRLGVKSVKEGCGIGECGACTVLIEGKPFCSCLTLSLCVDGKNVMTVEGLSPDVSSLHPLQASFIESGAVQCGFCTPGMLLSGYALLAEKTNPTSDEIKEAISGNLCRCTGYLPIVEAILNAAPKFYPVALSSFSPPRRTLRKEELLGLINETDDPVLVCGGTDLVVKMKKTKGSGHILYIGNCEELRGIRIDSNTLRIGAITTHSELATNALVCSLAPSLAIATRQLGSPQIRNSGTLGGNIVNASPAADTLPPLLVHNAEVVLESAKGRRTLPLHAFLKGPYSTDIGKKELLTEVCLEPLPDYKAGFIKVTRRRALAIARLSVAYAVKEEKGVIEDLRLSVGSCTPVPLRLLRVEEFMKGKNKRRDLAQKAAQMAVEEINAVAGSRPSHRYKLPVLMELLKVILS